LSTALRQNQAIFVDTLTSQVSRTVFLAGYELKKRVPLIYIPAYQTFNVVLSPSQVNSLFAQYEERLWDSVPQFI